MVCNWLIDWIEYVTLDYWLIDLSVWFIFFLDRKEAMFSVQTRVFETEKKELFSPEVLLGICVDIYENVLKGQSNEIFNPQFFLSFEPAWATD